MGYKRKASSLLMAGIIAFSGSSIALAAENETQVTDASVEQAETIAQEEVILTLNEVKEKLLEKDGTLQILDINLSKIRYQSTKLKGDLKDIQDGIDEIDADVDATGSIVSFVGTLQSLLNSESQIEQAIAQTEQGKALLELQNEELAVAIQYQAANVYVALLEMQQHLKLLETTIGQLETDLEVANIKYELGVASQTDIENIQRELDSLKKTKADLESQYEDNLTKLAIDLQIPEHAVLSLQPIEVAELAIVEKPESIDELIEQSFTMKRAKEELSLLQFLSKATQIPYERRNHTYDIQIKEQEIETNKYELQKAILTAYRNAEQAYLDVEDAKKQLTYAQNDYSKLETNFKLGLVSKQLYEKGILAIEQAENDVTSALHNYVIAMETIQALEKGFIITN